jgi:hypothetical protein
VSQLLESSTFLPYYDQAERESQEGGVIYGGYLSPSPQSEVEIDRDRLAKVECLTDAIQYLFFLIIDDRVHEHTVPRDIVMSFFNTIDLRYCVPALRSSYDESRLYYTCLLHELCLERELDTVRIILNALPIDVTRKELRRLDYLCIESNVPRLRPRAGQEVVRIVGTRNEDERGGDNGEFDRRVSVELFCTPLQASWETYLDVDDQQIWGNTNFERLESIRSLADLQLDTNKDIKGLLHTSLLILWAYDGRFPIPDTPSDPDDDLPLFFDGLMHVLAHLGHCGHISLLRLIVRLYPQCLKVENDDGDLPVHLFALDTTFYDCSRDSFDLLNNVRSDDMGDQNDGAGGGDETRRVEGHENGETQQLAGQRRREEQEYGLEPPNEEDGGPWRRRRNTSSPLLAILESYPQYASVPNKDGNLPIHIFLLSLKQNYERKERLRNLYVRHARQDAELLLEQPRTLNGADGDRERPLVSTAGRDFFPYHQNPFSVLRGLVKACCGKTLSHADEVHGLFPVMIAASNICGAPLDLVFYLLCEDPTALAF